METAERSLRADIAQLREVVARLAAIDRPSASDGERRAAEWIAGRLRERGCNVTVEAETAFGGYWWPVGVLSALGAASGLLSLSRRRGARATGLLGGAIAALGLADEAAAGPYVFRNLFLRRRATWNVVAEAGDRAASRTLVILAHHDAAHSGLLFHPAVPRWLYERVPERVEKAEESLPYWRLVVAGPALVAAGALLGTFLGRALTRIGIGMGVAAAALSADIGRSPVVPGANDNLSAVAVLEHVATAVKDRPVRGLRVLLVSCGSEESLQEGILAFGRRHFPELPVESTAFLVVDSVGSPELLMVEGEGTLKMHQYSSALKELLSALAEENGIELRRGLRARSSTDACIPRRHGYETALLASLNQYKAISNYHWPTDTAANVDYDTVAKCAVLAEALVRRLAES